jgi:hypothetical protein
VEIAAMPAIRRTPIVALALLAAACSKSDRTTADSSNGSVVARMSATPDSGNASGATPAAGGTAQVTATDAKSVTKATEYKLTDTNFRQFLAASDSLAALRARDPQARAFLDKDVSDAGTGTQVSDNDAGIKHLEAYAPIASAITSAGISVRDYFVAAIAIAQAERFMGNPKAAPPTPALSSNAQFLNAHQSELQALRARGGGR